MRQYELYLVIDAEVEEEDVNAIVERMTQLISSGDGETTGEVTKVEARGRRRLIYPVKKKSEGQDVLLYFQTPPQALTEMERVLKLDERVLRYLLVRADES
ncbi:MAG TPA: 30S ribosomal protein S6 [Anaerolineae bacterium]|nr:30S ribosomal protein S6 [Anaerolineae bacterium]